MPNLKWLDGYNGESIYDLLDLATTHRTDSLVLAIEQALQERSGRIGEDKLNDAEITVLAVEALEREVNNGGYHQFFLNTPGFAPYIVDALERINCPKTAEISAKAIALLGLRHPFTAGEVEKVLENDKKGRLKELLYKQCDVPYYNSGEAIADRLFEYIFTNRDLIHLP